MDELVKIEKDGEIIVRGNTLQEALANLTLAVNLIDPVWCKEHNIAIGSVENVEDTE